MRRRITKARTPLVDHFGNIIEIGDAYFYGSPPTAGRVTKISARSIEITSHGQVWDDGFAKWVDGETTMKCSSPEKGVCLDKTYDKKIT